MEFENIINQSIKHVSYEQHFKGTVCGGSTYICESGESPEVADTHQAKDKPLAPLNQDMRELV